MQGNGPSALQGYTSLLQNLHDFDPEPWNNPLPRSVVVGGAITFVSDKSWSMQMRKTFRYNFAIYRRRLEFKHDLGPKKKPSNRVVWLDRMAPVLRALCDHCAWHALPKPPAPKKEEYRPRTGPRSPRIKIKRKTSKVPRWKRITASWVAVERNIYLGRDHSKFPDQVFFKGGQFHRQVPRPSNMPTLWRFGTGLSLHARFYKTGYFSSQAGDMFWPDSSMPANNVIAYPIAMDDRPERYRISYEVVTEKGVRHRPLWSGVDGDIRVTGEDGNETEEAEEPEATPATAANLEAARELLNTWKPGGNPFANAQGPSQIASTSNPLPQTDDSYADMFSDINISNDASNGESNSHLPQPPTQVPQDQPPGQPTQQAPQPTNDPPMEEVDICDIQMKQDDGLDCPMYDEPAEQTSPASNVANGNLIEPAQIQMKEQQYQEAQQSFSFGELFMQQQMQREQELLRGQQEAQVQREQELLRSQQEAQMEALWANSLEGAVARSNNFWNVMANLGAACPPRPPMVHAPNPNPSPPTPEEQEADASRSHLENIMERERIARRDEKTFRYTVASSKGPGAISYLHRNTRPMKTTEALPFPRIARLTPIPPAPKHRVIPREFSRIYGTPRVRKLHEASRFGSITQEILHGTETVIPASSILGKRQLEDNAASSTSESPSKLSRTEKSVQESSKDRVKTASRKARKESASTRPKASSSKPRKHRREHNASSPSPTPLKGAPKESEPVAGTEPRPAPAKDKKSSSSRRESRRKAKDVQPTADPYDASSSTLGKRRREENATIPFSSSAPAPAPAPAPVILPWKRVRTSETTFKYVLNDQTLAPLTPIVEPPQPMSSVSRKEKFVEPQPLSKVLQKERIMRSCPSLLSSISGFFRFEVRP